VKGVPILYLPVMYYPINKEDRATGFLLPMYTASTLKGNTISNAFFLGHQPQPGCDVQLRLVLEDGPRVRQRVPVRALAVVVGRRALLHAQRAGDDVDTGTGQIVDVPGRRSFDARGIWLRTCR